MPLKVCLFENADLTVHTEHDLLYNTLLFILIFPIPSLNILEHNMKNDPPVGADAQSPVIVADIIEEAKQKTGKIQSYYANLSDSVFSSDTLFKLFKR